MFPGKNEARGPGEDTNDVPSLAEHPCRGTLLFKETTHFLAFFCFALFYFIVRLTFILTLVSFWQANVGSLNLTTIAKVVATSSVSEPNEKDNKVKVCVKPRRAKASKPETRSERFCESLCHVNQADCHPVLDNCCT